MTRAAYQLPWGDYRSVPDLAGHRCDLLRTVVRSKDVLLVYSIDQISDRYPGPGEFLSVWDHAVVSILLCPPKSC